ncbi:cytochrome c-type biogenesis protein CcmH [bacterium]|nr:cytochrome c-type biogenesis protein CcmH [bacterium]
MLTLKHSPIILTIILLTGLSVVAQGIQQNLSPKAAGDTSRTANLNQINNVARQLIAPCCWKQTVDVHSSESSDKIKKEIGTALSEGLTEEQIINRFIAEYGERILAIPRASGFNWMLWVLPALFLLAGSIVVVMILRHISHLRPSVEVSQPQSINDAGLKRIERELEEFDA